MGKLFTKEEIVDHLFFDGNSILISPISDESFCSKLGYKVPFIEVSIKDDEIYDVTISYFDGNIISAKYVPLLIEKFNCLEASDYNISIELKEDELEDFCSFFDENIWNVDFYSNW